MEKHYETLRSNPELEIGESFPLQGPHERNENYQVRIDTYLSRKKSE